MLCQTNNSRNSRQSLFSGIEVKAVTELDHDVQTLFGRQRRVVIGVGPIGVLEAGEHPGCFLHDLNYSG